MLLRPIRYLKAVADHGSLTRAASALHVSQPALSQQIREFEELPIARLCRPLGVWCLSKELDRKRLRR